MRRPLALFVIVLGGFALACGWLEDQTNVTYTEGIPVEFTLDADQVCPEDNPAFDDCSETSAPAPTDVELDRYSTDINVDVVEQTGNENLNDIADRLKSIEIVSIAYEVEDNDLTFDLQEVDLYMGPLTSGEPEHDGVVKLTTIPRIPAGQDTSGTADVDEFNRDAVSDLLMNLKFSAIPSTEPTIEQGEQLPPKGSADISLTVNVRFVANPIDAATGGDD